MKRFPVPASLSISLLAGFGADAVRTGAAGRPAFRVRSDFAAALNADQGWAGVLDEDVSIQADQPFRIRFEVEQPPDAAFAPRRGESRVSRTGG